LPTPYQPFRQRSTLKLGSWQKRSVPVLFSKPNKLISLQ
jgi:hypothetical protein